MQTTRNQNHSSQSPFMTQNTDADFNLPKQISIDYYDDYMHISRKWFNFETIMQTIAFVMFSIIALVFIFDDTGTSGKTDSFIIFLSIFAIISLFTGYYTLMGWVNKTDVFVSKNIMETKIGPLPWFGGKRIDSSQIKQFYSKKRITGSGDKRKTSFEVHYIQNDDKEKGLLANITTRHQAEFIERKIEEYLGITNDASINKDD